MNQHSTIYSVAILILLLACQNLYAGGEKYPVGAKRTLDLCDPNISLDAYISIRASSFHEVEYLTNKSNNKMYLALIKGPGEYLSSGKGKNDWNKCTNKIVLEFIELPARDPEKEQLNFDCHDFNDEANPPGVAFIGIVKNEYGLQKARVAWEVDISNKGNYITESKSDRLYCTVLPGIDAGG